MLSQIPLLHPNVGHVVSPRILSLTLQDKSSTRTGEVAIGRAVVAGWTGRDPAAVEKHIRELEALGVKRPATKARQGINPFTKQPMTFPAKAASKSVRARPIKAIKDALA